MNREQKRMMQRQGQVDAASRRAAQEGRQRTSPSQFFREVREEMRQVAWPTRPETKNYTTIVGVVLIFMTLLIFGLGYEFSKFVNFLFQQ
jgi:preprotein translocase subunit SecE